MGKTTRRIEALERCAQALHFSIYLPYGIGAPLLSWWWAQPVVQAWNRRTLRRKYRGYPLYRKRGRANRETLQRHFNCLFFRNWRVVTLDRCSERTFARWVHFQGTEHLDAAKSEGKGLILACAHWGASQTLKSLLPRFGLDVVTFGGGASRGRLKHANVFWLEDGADHSIMLRALVAARKGLQRGGAVLFPADGYHGKSALEVPFLGRRRKFPLGFATLATTTGAPVVPVFARLQADGRIEVEFHPALTPLESGKPRAERVENLIRQYVALLEEKWREDPALIKTKFMMSFLRFPLDQSALDANAPPTSALEL